MGKQQTAQARYNLRANRKINGWTLSKQLGSGGNGEVWMCRNDKKEEYGVTCKSVWKSKHNKTPSCTF